jgi:hypothetical protein
MLVRIVYLPLALRAQEAIDDLLVYGVDRCQLDACHAHVIVLHFGQHLPVEVTRVVVESWIPEPHAQVGERLQGRVQVDIEVPHAEPENDTNNLSLAHNLAVNHPTLQG